jgi:hypothetical protein
MLRLTWAKPAFADRFAAAGVGAVVAGIAAFAVFCTIFGLAHFIPDLFGTYRADFETRQPAYEWIARHAPADANVYAYEDPLVFLYTGHAACRLPIPPKFLYHSDDRGIVKLMGSLADFARGYHLNYLLLTPDDYHRDLNARGTAGLVEAMQSSDFRELYASKNAAIYQLNPASGVQPAGGSLAYNHSK